MHSIHSHDLQAQQQQPPQVQAQRDEEQGTMTVLETLDPANQQVIGLVEPQQQQQHLVRAHLVQPATGTTNPADQSHTPHLHQLQPSQQHTSSSSQIEPASHMTVEEQQVGHLTAVQQQQTSSQRAQTGSGMQNNLLRQRPQIEGIVADGGGPIVQWLLDNYEIADGESLPRSTVYNHYLAHCRHLQMASVNAASFGKLIRSVFIGLKTRRLGTRGHSKYHYFGVRAKQHIQQELLQHQESGGASCSRDMSTTNNENSNQNTDNGSESDSMVNECAGGRLSSHSDQSGRRMRRGQAPAFRRGQQIYQQQPHQTHLRDQHKQQHPELEMSNNGVYYTNSNGTNGFEATGLRVGNEHLISSSSTLPNISNTLEHVNHCELADFRNYLGANWTTLVEENWPQCESCSIEQQLVKSTGLSDLANNLSIFEIKYKTYYKRMVELLSELKFLEVEQLWLEFWHPVQQHDSTQLEWSGLSSVGSNGTQGNQEQQQQQQQQNGQPTVGDLSHQNINYHQPQPQQLNLTFHQVYQLTSQPIVVDWINHVDYNLYAALESFLIPDMLSPIPRALAQQIRLFAKNIGPWIEMAVKDFDHRFVAEKSKSARAFGYALRRYTSLNHLSTASRAIWEKRSSLAQMSIDLSRVDLRDIEHQVSLMSYSSSNNIRNSHNNEHPTNLFSTSTEHQMAQSTSSTITDNNNGGTNTTNNQGTPTNNQNNSADITTNHESNLMDHQHNNNTSHNNSNNLDSQHQHQHPQHLCAMQPAQLIQNFLHLLEDPYPANSWPDWCRNLVESRVCGLSLEEARNFVLKWNFYISLIMKELTLRSAPSFGSFQLIRLLFDEYIFYLVVSRLAQAQHKTPAQLLSL